MFNLNGQIAMIERCGDTGMWGWEDGRMWGWEDVGMGGCGDGRMWGWIDRGDIGDIGDRYI